ncbi:uncharacterized protein VTP21DRAFT_9935 [Calcarisporiella thermophila]|uniref:uncharacterized protein n=1 Tax=Calcarisporiella thermophila TaxID=911321 RepID=UPI0037429E16
MEDVLEDVEATCLGCNREIEEGAVVSFGGNIWHIECFKCAKCHSLVDCDSKLLLLSSGLPICQNCSYKCKICGHAITDKAILAEPNDAYHEECFRCTSCQKRISDLTFIQTSKGVFCPECYQRRKSSKSSKSAPLGRKPSLFEKMRDKTLPNISQLTSRKQSPHPFSSSTSSHRANNSVLPWPLLHSSSKFPNNTFGRQETHGETQRGPSEETAMDGPGDFLSRRPNRRGNGSQKWIAAGSGNESNLSVAYPRTSLDVPIELSPSPVQPFIALPRPKKSSHIDSFVDSYFTAMEQGGTSGEIKTPSERLTWGSSLEEKPSAVDRLSQILLLGIPNSSTLRVHHASGIESEAGNRRTFGGNDQSLDKAIDTSAILKQTVVMAEVESGTAEVLPPSVEEVAVLRQELQTLLGKLADIEANLEEIRDVGRRAVEEFQSAKQEFANEAVLRQQAEETVAHLQRELEIYKALTTATTHTYKSNEIHGAGLHVDTTNQPSPPSDALIAGRLGEVEEQACCKCGLSKLDFEHKALEEEVEKLRKTRDALVLEIEEMRSRQVAAKAASKEEKEKESEEKAREESSLSEVDNLSTDLKRIESPVSIGTVHAIHADIQPPKKLDWKKAISRSASPRMLEEIRHGQHCFNSNNFLKPVKCEMCGEKIWGRGEVRCSDCGMISHMRCLAKVPSWCHGEANRKYFGRELKLEDDHPPYLLRQLVSEVERRGMDAEGIYRKTGATSTARLVQQLLTEGHGLEESDLDIHAVASVLKMYLRGLPQPLLPPELHDKWIDALGLVEESKRIDGFKRGLSQLPYPNYVILKYLMLHLDRIQNRSDKNLMPARNLSVVFGPTLMGDHANQLDLTALSQANLVVEFLVQHATELFSEDLHPSKGKMSPAPPEKEDINTKSTLASTPHSNPPNPSSSTSGSLFSRKTSLLRKTASLRRQKNPPKPTELVFSI